MITIHIEECVMGSSLDASGRAEMLFIRTSAGLAYPIPPLRGLVPDGRIFLSFAQARQLEHVDARSLRERWIATALLWAEADAARELRLLRAWRRASALAPMGMGTRLRNHTHANPS